MTKLQILIVSLLAGLVTLVFIGLAVLIIIPLEQLPFDPTPTVTFIYIPPTSTLPSLLPTLVEASSPQPVEPSPTNTRVPTVTPLPEKTATPTIVINLPTPVILPTHTSTPVPRPLPTSTPIPQPTATRFIPLGYHISFSAEETEVERGKCTHLKWEIEGGASVMLDGESVDFSGKKKVCPTRDKTYRLEVKVRDEFVVENREVKIKIVTPLIIPDPDF